MKPSSSSFSSSTTNTTLPAAINEPAASTRPQGKKTNNNNVSSSSRSKNNICSKNEKKRKGKSSGPQSRKRKASNDRYRCKAASSFPVYRRPPPPAPAAATTTNSSGASSAVAVGSTSGRSGTMQMQVLPHHRDRQYDPLGLEEDENWLSSFQCFVRSEFMEVVKANQFDVMVRSTSKSIHPNQVGVRCRFCAHLPPGSRSSRSSAFPSSIDKLYQSFSMMVRDHFVRCPELPPDLFRKFQFLKGKNAQGATDSKQYWVYAAQKLGMKDAASGIEMTEESKTAVKSMLPYGMTTPVPLFVAMYSNDPPLLSAAAGAVVVVGGGDNDDNNNEGAAANNEAAILTPFLRLLLKHLRLVHLLPSERVGKRKGLPVGLEGLGCSYCFQEGRLGFSRCFPLRRRALPSHVEDLYQHCMRCTLFPDEAKKELMAVEKQDKLTTTPNSIKAERETLSYALIWGKMGRKRDLTTT